MSLAEDAKAAKAAGVSYGTYMMAKGFKPYLKPEEKRCVNCGGVLYGAQQRFCSRECREEMKVKNRKGDKFV